MSFPPWQLAAIDGAGYNGIREEHIVRVAQELRRTGKTDIDRTTFDQACRRCGIDSGNFTQQDLDALERKLNA